LFFFKKSKILFFFLKGGDASLVFSIVVLFSDSYLHLRDNEPLKSKERKKIKLDVSFS